MVFELIGPLCCPLLWSFAKSKQFVYSLNVKETQIKLTKQGESEKCISSNCHLDNELSTLTSRMAMWTVDRNSGLLAETNYSFEPLYPCMPLVR